MDSFGFHTLVKNFTNLNEAECAEVSALSKEYPYSQILYLLHSRAAHDLQSPEKGEILQQSAVYSTDRSILKWVMTAGRKERISAPVMSPQLMPVQQELHVEESAPIIVPNNSPAFESVSLSGDALRNDIYLELEKLQKLMQKFAESFEEFQKSKTRENESRPKLNNTKEPVTDPLLEEIKSTKKKLKADSLKQKEQNEIIDHFIKTQPMIPKPKSVDMASDLAEDSGIFSDNIVSETLVNILLKQGKKDKAIEVLKKLIWKFPQKKAYFAAQIENLKN